MTAVTLIADLAVAVIAGIVFSALWFAWSAGGTLRVEPSLEPVPGIDAQDESGEEGDESGRAPGAGARKVYTIHGQLFFGSTTPFLEAFDAASDPKVVTLIGGLMIADMNSTNAVGDDGEGDGGPKA